jgi:hypothetical protein
MVLTIRTPADLDGYMDKVREAARRAQERIASEIGDPLAALRRMKFEPIGCHPVEHRALNLIEQINQTWTYVAALAATRQLLASHPDAGGFRLAPGAHAPFGSLDIMSEAEGLVGAETFAAVKPTNNGKLKEDLDKMAKRPELHRYVFFYCPNFPVAQRLSQLERGGVQVWNVAV